MFLRLNKKSCKRIQKVRKRNYSRLIQEWKPKDQSEGETEPKKNKKQKLTDQSRKVFLHFYHWFNGIQNHLNSIWPLLSPPPHSSHNLLQLVKVEMKIKSWFAWMRQKKISTQTFKKTKIVEFWIRFCIKAKETKFNRHLPENRFINEIL